MLLVTDEMCSDMILDDFGHQTSYRPSRTGDEVHHLLATSLVIDCALNCVDLTPDAADARQQLLLLADRVCHAVI